MVIVDERLALSIELADLCTRLMSTASEGISSRATDPSAIRSLDPVMLAGTKSCLVSRSRRLG